MCCMDVVVSISDELAAKLKDRANANGEAVPAYISKLVEQAIQSPSLEELLAPLQADFARTGMSQEELLNFGWGLLEKVRSYKSDQICN
jgi:hypothetical protein